MLWLLSMFVDIQTKSEAGECVPPVWCTQPSYDMQSMNYQVTRQQPPDPYQLHLAGNGGGVVGGNTGVMDQQQVGCDGRGGEQGRDGETDNRSHGVWQQL